jgi:hypothetical protein
MSHPLTRVVSHISIPADLAGAPVLAVDAAHVGRGCGITHLQGRHSTQWFSAHT